jgi:DNA-binding GntR family transcriptional regulator
MSEERSRLTGPQKIRTDPLRDQVRAQVKQLILTNQLRPGQSIVMDQLASELGVSHTPVREALAMLEHDGLVRMKPYGHPRVAEIDASDVREAWEMRLLLEGWAIGKAVGAVSEEALDEIGNWLEQARRDAQQSRYESHLQADIALHEMILSSHTHKLFQRLAELVTDQSVRIRSLVEAVAPKEQVFGIIDEHFAILEALRARDAELARERLMAHLEAGMQRTLAALDKLRTDGEVGTPA